MLPAWQSGWHIPGPAGRITWIPQPSVPGGVGGCTLRHGRHGLLLAPAGLSPPHHRARFRLLGATAPVRLVARDLRLLRLSSGPPTPSAAGAAASFSGRTGVAMSSSMPA